MMQAFDNGAMPLARQRTRTISTDGFICEAKKPAPSAYEPSAYERKTEQEVPRRSRLKQVGQDRTTSITMLFALLFFAGLITMTWSALGLVGSGDRPQFGEHVIFEDDIRYNQLYNAILDWGYTAIDVLENENSPQGRALKWLSDEDIETNDVEVARTRFALAALYFSTHNIADDSGTPATWHTQTNWLSNNPVCFWYGVECIEGGFFGRVQALNLSSNGLAGTIAQEIGPLETDIRVLDLGNNSIRGPLPKSIAALEKLGK